MPLLAGHRTGANALVTQLMVRQSVGTPATAALTRAGVPFTVHAYDHDPSAESFGLEAAVALGLDPAVVFKTLLVQADQHIVVAITPVSSDLDLKAVARAAGAKKARMADPATAERLTGQRNRLSVLIDESAAGLEKVYVSAGRRGYDLGLTPADLLKVTGASYAPIRSGISRS